MPFPNGRNNNPMWSNVFICNREIRLPPEPPVADTISDSSLMSYWWVYWSLFLQASRWALLTLTPLLVGVKCTRHSKLFQFDQNISKFKFICVFKIKWAQASACICPVTLKIAYWIKKIKAYDKPHWTKIGRDFPRMQSFTDCGLHDAVRTCTRTILPRSLVFPFVYVAV